MIHAEILEFRVGATRLRPGSADNADEITDEEVL
jgi:hypothetical protein